MSSSIHGGSTDPKQLAEDGLALTVACPVCKSGPSEPCMTRSLGTPRWPHGQRLDAARARS